MQINLTTTAEQDSAIDKVIAQIPLGEGEVAPTPEEYLTARIQGVLSSYVNQIVGQEAAEAAVKITNLSDADREEVLSFIDGKTPVKSK